jgi:hypothetical protein
MDRWPRVAIHASEDDPASRCDRDGKEKGWTEVATMASSPCIS